MENINDNFANNEDSEKTSTVYLNQAIAAQEAGNPTLAIHLFLAAFDMSLKESPEPCEQAINGMKYAWTLTVSTKQQSLAEYLFERIEPYLSGLEKQRYIEDLQNLTMDKLEEIGISRDELEDMNDAIMQGLEDLGIDDISDIHFGGLFGVPQVQQTPQMPQVPQNAYSSLPVPPPGVPASAVLPPAKTQQTQGFVPNNITPNNAAQVPNYPGMPGMNMPPVFPFAAQGPIDLANLANSIGAYAANAQEQTKTREIVRFDYSKLYGYETAIDDMRSLGIGSKNDEQLDRFIKMLNRRYGLKEIPRTDTLVFRAPSREDADQFMEATFGELGLPGVRMNIEENSQGQAVLCVMAQRDNGLQMNSRRNEIIGKGALLLSNIDLWSRLLPCGEDSLIDCAMLSRAAHEALHLIETAVENPDVIVLASASSELDISQEFLEMLGPVTFVGIENPNEQERTSLWNSILKDYRSIDKKLLPELVKYSNGMARFDIAMAAREAVENAYKSSLVARKYREVSKTDLFEQLAAYQMIDSEEYAGLEQAIVDDFSSVLDEFDSVDALLGTEEPANVNAVKPANAKASTAADEVPEAVSEPEPEPKPKRTRKPRATKAAQPEELEQAEAPKRTRKPRAKKAAEEPEQAKVHVDAPVEAQKAEKPKRTRKPRATKAAQPEEPEQTEAPKRTRKPRAKKPTTPDDEQN